MAGRWRERGDVARKTPSEEPHLAKVGMFDVSTTLQLRQGRQLEFCHQGLADPLPTRRRTTIFGGGRSLDAVAILFLLGWWSPLCKAKGKQE